jgi:hypothetical protein
MENNNYAKDYGIYRKSKNGNGSAFKLSFNKGSRKLFLEAAKRNGDKFDWDNKIIMKLDLTDIGKILCALETNPAEISNGQSSNGFVELADIYHDPAMKTGNRGKTSTILKVFYKQETKAFGLVLSKKEAGSDVNRISIGLFPEERKNLVKLLEFALPRILNWE